MVNHCLIALGIIGLPCIQTMYCSDHVTTVDVARKYNSNKQNYNETQSSPIIIWSDTCLLGWLHPNNIYRHIRTGTHLGQWWRLDLECDPLYNVWIIASLFQSPVDSQRCWDAGLLWNILFQPRPKRQGFEAIQRGVGYKSQQHRGKSTLRKFILTFLVLISSKTAKTHPVHNCSVSDLDVLWHLGSDGQFHGGMVHLFFMFIFF